MPENNTKLSDSEQADQFIQRLHDLEIVFSPRPKKEKDLAKISQEISEHILEYQRSTGMFRELYARALMFWVNKAYSMGFITEGEGLKKKITELKQDNNSLQDRLKECIERCEQLEKEKRDLIDYYRDRSGGSIVGDPFDQ